MGVGTILWANMWIWSNRTCSHCEYEVTVSVSLSLSLSPLQFKNTVQYNMAEGGRMMVKCLIGMAFGLDWIQSECYSVYDMSTSLGLIMLWLILGATWFICFVFMRMTMECTDYLVTITTCLSWNVFVIVRHLVCWTRWGCWAPLSSFDLLSLYLFYMKYVIK